jgi:uncharacterized protein YaeQ
MALKATIFKAHLQISDLDRGYYGEHALTLARHPSETDERMMVRLLTFALYADEQLSFTRGLSTVEEPDLWQKSLTDEVLLWIDLGQPDVRRIAKACGRAQQVVIVSYGGRTADVWWEKTAADWQRFANLTILNLPFAATKTLATWSERQIELQVTISEGQIWLSHGEDHLEVTPTYWLRPD